MNSIKTKRGFWSIVIVVLYILLSLYLCLMLSIIEKYDMNMFYNLHSTGNVSISYDDCSLSYTKVPCFILTLVVILCCFVLRQMHCLPGRIQHLVTWTEFVIIGIYNVYMVLVTLIINSHLYVKGDTDYLSTVTHLECPIILLYDIITLLVILIGKSATPSNNEKAKRPGEISEETC